MRSKAVRLYGKNNLRLEEFEFSKVKNDEILAKVIADNICVLLYGVVCQCFECKHIPSDTFKNPAIISHKFTGELIEISAKWNYKFKVKQKFTIQSAIYYKNGPIGELSVMGYSCQYIGGDATFEVIPKDVLVQDCLFIYEGSGYYSASLSKPLNCVILAIDANYHTTPKSYRHDMEIVDWEKMAILAEVVLMGLAAIGSVIMREDRKSSLLVVTDINPIRLDRVASIHSPECAKSKGIDLNYVNTSEENPVSRLWELTSGAGFNDMFVFAPFPLTIEQADVMLGYQRELNFFAGLANPQFSVKLNFYKIHYIYTLIAGTSGGNNVDMAESLKMFIVGLGPAGLITNISGLNTVISIVLNLPNISRGKKLIYMQKDVPQISSPESEKRKIYPFLCRIG